MLLHTRKGRKEDYDYILVEFNDDKVQYMCKKNRFDFSNNLCQWKDRRYYPATILRENLNKNGK